MSGLTGWISDGLESLGLNGDDVKPINQGEAVDVVQPQESEDSFWGFLDDLGTTVKNGVADIAQSAVQAKINDLKFGPEKSYDTTGAPSDQAGSYAPPKTQSTLQQYKTPLLIGAALLLGAVVVKKVL
jgi:hypothetical protein